MAHAVVQPETVVVELRSAPLAAAAVFGVRVDVGIAQMAEKLVVFLSEVLVRHPAVALVADDLIRGVGTRCLDCEHHYKEIDGPGSHDANPQSAHHPLLADAIVLHKLSVEVGQEHDPSDYLVRSRWELEAVLVFSRVDELLLILRI